MKYRNARTLTGRLAIMSLAAIALCFLITTAPASPGSDNKALTQAERALRQGEYERAEQIYRELLNKDAHDNEARLGLSFALLKQRNLQPAYDHAARALQFRDNPVPHERPEDFLPVRVERLSQRRVVAKRVHRVPDKPERRLGQGLAGGHGLFCSAVSGGKRLVGGRPDSAEVVEGGDRRVQDADDGRLPLCP